MTARDPVGLPDQNAGAPQPDDPDAGAWLDELLGGRLPNEGQAFVRLGHELVVRGGVVRDRATISAQQGQTRDTFAFKWSKKGTYESEGMQNVIAPWLKERYGDLITPLCTADSDPPRVLDAGCGAGNAAALLFGDQMAKISYVGVDISDAVDLARERLADRALRQAFIQADLMDLPLPQASFDLVLSEGVLHHTPSTKAAIEATARMVRPGGTYAIYVYNKKSPVREFTDDYIRERISELPPQEAWDQLLPLTKLGRALGELDVEIDVPEDVELIGIPKGKVNLQRLFYWHVCKLFYRHELTIEEMNHINFDWYMPKYCHRQGPDEVRNWCEGAGITIDRLHVEPAGITVVGRRRRTSSEPD